MRVSMAYSEMESEVDHTEQGACLHLGTLQNNTKIYYHKLTGTTYYITVTQSLYVYSLTMGGNITNTHIKLYLDIIIKIDDCQ